jgi:hypothetical protein
LWLSEYRTRKRRGQKMSRTLSPPFPGPVTAPPLQTAPTEPCSTDCPKTNVNSACRGLNAQHCSNGCDVPPVHHKLRCADGRTSLPLMLQRPWCNVKHSGRLATMKLRRSFAELHPWGLRQSVAASCHPDAGPVIRTGHNKDS